MLFCVLGNITFQALGSPQSIESSLGWRYAEHKTVESTPKLQWVGAELGELSLDILLHTLFANPATDRAALYAAAQAHQAMALVFGNGDHRGYFVIEKISESAQKLADDGSFISITLKLSLKQWARSIEIDPNAPPQPATPPPAIIVGPLAPGQNVAGTVNATGTAGAGGVSALAITPEPIAPPSESFDPLLVPTSEVCRMDPNVGGILS